MARTKKTAAAEKETKKNVKAAEVKAEAVETKAAAAEAKAEEVKAEVKAEEKKAPAKKAPAKKAAPKKPETVEAKIAETKPAETKPVETKVDFFVEFGGVQVAAKEVVKNVKATIGKDAKEIAVYLKPEESKAYFVADGEKGEMDVYFC